MSDNKPLVVIVGVTGNQGGSVARTLLSIHKYRLRGLTRDPSKSSAKALQEQGVEIVKADIGNREDLCRAFQGAYVVFAVTDFWAHKDGQRERREGYLMADVAKECGVQHFIFSGLPRRPTETKYTSTEHIDTKYDIEDHIKEIGIPTTFIHTGWFLKNLTTIYKPTKDLATNTWVLRLPASPTTTVATLDVEADVGKAVLAALEHKEEYLGRAIICAHEHMTFAELMERWGKALGVKARFEQISRDEYEKMVGGYQAITVADLFAIFEEAGEFGKPDPDLKPWNDLVGGYTPLENYVKSVDWKAILNDGKDL